MIVEGQIQGGLDRRRRHRADGDRLASTSTATASTRSLMDYLIPTALEVPDWENGTTVTPVAAPPDRRQGRRRVGHRRLAAGGRQRGDRRARAVRRPARRHAAHPVAGLGGDARATCARLRTDRLGSRSADDPHPAARVRDRGAARVGQGRRRRHRGHRGRRVAARRPAAQGARRPAVQPHRRPGSPSRPGGLRLASRAVEMLGLQDRTVLEVREAGAGRRMLRLGTSSLFAEYAAPGLISLFADRAKDLDVELSVHPTARLRAAAADPHRRRRRSARGRPARTPRSPARCSSTTR